jgi:hypothetical protein
MMNVTEGVETERSNTKIKCFKTMAITEMDYSSHDKTMECLRPRVSEYRKLFLA